MTTRSLPASLGIRRQSSRGPAWLDRLRLVLHAIASRRHLAEMDQRMLADIGISRAEALEEAARAPWDLAPPRR